MKECGEHGPLVRPRPGLGGSVGPGAEGNSGSGVAGRSEDLYLWYRKLV